MVLPYNRSVFTEGWHSVAVGLRGLQTTSQQTWQWWRLKYDHTPPVLVLTNPASTVNQPMVQLQGYANEALSSLSYDLTNSNGLATNQQVLVLNHFYDTNTWEFTTNWFQAFDVPLAVGTNVFTFHAADLAGNLTNTNLTVVLDYSTRTNPPVITLYWPTNGSAISGTNFTWRGNIDDFTGTVTAQLVDTNGNTNQYPGLVERNGNFWVENLPLTTGTNALTLTAVDSAGNTNQTNINVTQSGVNLTIDPLTWTNTVTGTMDTAGYTVWVNGVKATISGSAWSATNVPLETTGTALVEARAIPNSDNGGNGTGGSGGSVTSLDVPGNPASINPQDVESELDRPMGIFYQSYHSVMYEQWLSGDVGATGPDSYWEDTGWANGGGGTKPDLTIDGGSLSTNALSLMWPPSSWPLPVPETEYWNGTVWVPDGESGVLDLNPQFADVPQAWYAKTYQFNLNRAADLTLSAGGKAGTGRESLFEIPFDIYALSLPPMTGLDDTDPPSEHLVPTLIDPRKVRIGNLGYLGADSKLWVVLEDGESVDVTPRVDGQPFYGFYFDEPVQHHLSINASVGETNVTLDPNAVSNATFIVGQTINFSPQWDVEPTGVLTNYYKWSFGGHYFNAVTNAVSGGASPTSSDIPYLNTNLLTDATIIAWWVSGSYTQPIVYTATLDETVVFTNGQAVSYHVEGKFSMTKPDAHIMPWTRSVSVMQSNGHLKLIFTDSTNYDGITFSNSITVPPPFTGSTTWVQVDLSPASDALDSNGVDHIETELGLGPYLDTSLPYASIKGSTPVDSPGLTLDTDLSAYVTAMDSDSFEMWMMFQPAGGTIVPLRAVTWSWSGAATNTASGWVLVNGTNTQNPALDFPTEVYPLWRSNVTNDQMIPGL